MILLSLSLLLLFTNKFLQDPEEFSTAMAKVMDKSVSQRMGAAGKLHVEKLFSR
jgi:hypothetical protein